ncbi:isocitrate/isopropylmalate family dehydrogenase [Rickettsiales bacterium]|nr:isocitrate/isopropylmalate family dehydrogenase [Rickettsiales bacterium]
MSRKINVSGELVILHGDEMAQVAFEKIIEQFVRSKLNIKLHEIDLSAKNRLRTNGAIVQEAIDALLIYKVGIKNAGITVNKKQLDEFIKDLKKEGYKLSPNTLHPLSKKSPNGTIRKGIAGNITREDIPFKNLKSIIPDWKNQNIDVITMDSGGLLGSFNRVSQFSGILKLSFIDSKGINHTLHTRPIQKGNPYLLATNDTDKICDWAREFFQRAADEDRPAYVGLKDTVMPGYDGAIRDIVDKVFHEEFEGIFKAKELTYEYGLIDAQAAMIVSNPPKNALWGIPDNTSGRKMHKLVESLKKYGIPQRTHQTAISRMSAGGGDQYGSYNAPAPDNGIITLMIGQRILHSREVKSGDPMILMSNDASAIKDWVRQSFEAAKKKDQEIYFGLKREYMAYDALFGDIINEVRDELSEGGKTPPPLMMMTPSKQIRKMITDPPRNALYSALNMDGDIFSDITAALGGSLATASSIIASADGTMLFEAPHGTAPDLYRKYLASKGKEALFNPAALIYAVANALEVIAEREGSQELMEYSNRMKIALVKTVDSGTITGDLHGKTKNPETENVVDMFGFLDAVERNLD